MLTHLNSSTQTLYAGSAFNYVPETISTAILALKGVLKSN